jgi:thioester reductase-like protein
VRATDARDGAARIRRTLARYGLWDDALAFRIVPVPGDLGVPRFGMSAAAFAALAAEVGAVYHNGAVVSALQTYAALKAANVRGTHEAVRLAALAGGRPLHFVSTLSVLPTRHFPGTLFTEDDEAADAAELPDGYGQSKWVAERLVRAADARGIPATIHRPGRITGHSRTGAANADDLLYTMIRACLAMEAVPDVALPIDMTPVDYVARAIVALAGCPAARGRVFHLVNPRPIPLARLAELLAAGGRPLTRLPYGRWRAAFAEHAARAGAGTLGALDGVLPDADAPPAATAAHWPYGCATTVALLRELGVGCPPIDADLVGRYVAWLLDAGAVAPVAASTTAVPLAAG